MATPSSFGGGDHLVVALRAAGLDDRLDAGGHGGPRAVVEREERVGRQRGAGRPVARLLDRQPHRVDAAALAGADADRRQVAGDHDRVRPHVLAQPPREQQVAPAALVGRGLADHPHRVAVVEVRVAVLDEHAAQHAAEVALARAGLAPLAVLQDPQLALPAQHLEPGVVVAGREQHLDELLVQRSGQLLRDRAVDGDHAAVGGQRVGRQRLARTPPRPSRRPRRRTGCRA